MNHDYSTIQRDGFNIPLIGIPKMGTLEFCLDCQYDFGILNYHDGDRYVIFDGKRFLCNICKEKLDKMEEIYEKTNI